MVSQALISSWKCTQMQIAVNKLCHTAMCQGQKASQITFAMSLPNNFPILKMLKIRQYEWQCEQFSHIKN